MQESRSALSVDRIIEVCRELLVEGGVDTVVVREVARRLSVSAPALYKYTAGRDDLLTLLIASCHDGVAVACDQARESVDAADSPGQLLAATHAFRLWALQHPREFGLLYGQPIVGYLAPPDGPTTASAQRFGTVFASIYAQLLRDGRLRLPAVDELPEGFEASLAGDPLPREHRLPPTAVYQFVVGFQRMLGLVSVEVAGHLDWAMTDTDNFAARQLRELHDELILPESGIRRG